MEDPIDWGVGCDSHDHSDTETTSPSSTIPAAPPSAKAAPNVDGAVDAEQDTYRGSPQNFIEDAADAEKNTYQQSPQSFDEAHEQWHIPLGEPLPRSPVAAPSSSKLGLSRSQRARIGVHSNRRQPTKEDYTDYVLHQANQKVYEASFLKLFVNHALHPDQIDSIVPQSEDCASLESYLKEVRNNLNHIVAKMIFNTHSRTVNIFANDERDSAYFWDHQQFPQKLFSDFCPANTFPVVDRMQQSWYRAWESPPMVRYTKKHYPIGKHCSPIEEIDEVSGTLFSRCNETLPTGRAVKTPSKASKYRRSGAETRREIEVNTHNGWLNDLAHHPMATRNYKESTREEPRAGDVSTSIEGIAANVNMAKSKQDVVIMPATSSNDHVLTSLSEKDASQSLDVLMEDASPPLSWRTRLIDDHKRRLAERWPREKRASISDLDTSTIVKQAVVHGVIKPCTTGLPESILTLEQSSALFAWRTRTRLIDDHKRRLAERWPRQPILTRSSCPDLKTAVERAVASGLLKAPPPKLWEKIAIAARIEQRKQLRAFRRLGELVCQEQPFGKSATKSSAAIRKRKRPIQPDSDLLATSVEPPTKKRKNNRKIVATSADSEEPVSFPSHPSGSKTLEPHQILPPEAYFEQKTEDETPVWRCGIRHALGYYYNAGDRKNCWGCFTSISTNPRLKWMDFYLPSRSCFYQAAPGVVWNPSKNLGKERRCKSLSHNSIAKEAFWDAVNTGATADAARKCAVEAVEEYLRPKTPPRKSIPPPPPPPPSPPPTINVGPHPSGSKTMEHGQDLPSCSYWEKKDRHDEPAWRCDVNHALGRYYLSGTKKTCPGCGTNKSGVGKHVTMDFYLPDSAVVRQEAPELVKWVPRKPYKIKAKRDEKRQIVKSHNQMCSKAYWVAVQQGKAHDEALMTAIDETDKELDARDEANRIKQELEAATKAKHAATQATDGDDGEASGSLRDQSEVDHTYCEILSVITRSEDSEAGDRKESDGAEEDGHVTSSDDVTSSSDSEESV